MGRTKISGQQIGTVVGGVVGAFFGVPQLGMAIGGLIGGIVDPTKINGPHIGDGQQQTSTDGSPIAWIMGTAKIAGTLAWAGPRTEVKIKDSGKGGPTVSHYESRQSFAIVVCESSELKGSTIDSVLMVEQDGKLVYDVRPGSAMLADSQKWAANVTFYYGAEDQLPPAIIEADKGVGNTPAYRGVLLAVFDTFNIYAAGDRIPTFKFTVQSTPEPSIQTSGGTAYPDTRTIETGIGQRHFTLTFAAYGAPDRFVVRDGDGTTVLLDTGYYGDTSRQSELDTAVAAHGDVAGPITESKYPYAFGTDPDHLTGSIWDYPDLLDRLTFTASGDYASIYVDAYGPLATGWSYSVEFGAGGVTLASCVEDICARGGLDSSDIDTSGIDGITVIGYPIARQCTGTDALTPLLAAYFAFGTDYDSKLRFAFYGGDAAITVDRDDLIEGNDANNGAITENTRNQATEFPRRIVGSYMDPDQNYEVVNVTAERLSASVIAIGDTQFAIPVVMPADQAAQAVNKALKVDYATLEGTRDYCVPYARTATYLTVCAGEPVLMDSKRWVVDQIDVSSGYLKFSTRYDRQSAYTSNVQAILGNDPRPPTSIYSGPTTLIAMNLPSLRPQDTYGVYLAAKGTNDQTQWRGCNVQVSYDGQQSWQTAVTITQPSVLGTLAEEIPSGGEPITVDVGDGELESVTAEQIDAQMNAFALIDSNGTAEIGQFQAADLQSGGDYELTDVSRGLNGTTEGDHDVGDDFVMLDAVYFLPIDTAFSGETIYFRAVGFGEVAEDQPVISIVYQPDMTIIHDGGTVT